MIGECEKCGEHAVDCVCVLMIRDSDLQKYVAEALAEQVIRGHEDQILAVMKQLQEKHPSENNDNEWMQYTNFICRRRYKFVTPPTGTVTL